MEGCVALTRVGLLAVVMLMANEHIGIDTGSRGMLVWPQNIDDDDHHRLLL